jgi:hypothetical protein
MHVLANQSGNRAIVTATDTLDRDLSGKEVETAGF